MDPIEGEFVCRKCQTPLSIFKILVNKKGFAFFDVSCQKKHTGKRKFNMAQQNEWMPTVIKHLYMCPRCGSNLTDLRQKSEGDKTLLTLNCPTHGKIKKSVSTSFWYAMDALRKQLSARPAYPPAYPGPYSTQYPPSVYPPQYSQPPAPPDGVPPPGIYPPAGSQPPTGSPPPETISPPQLEVSPPTKPPMPSSSINTVNLPSTDNNIDAGEICPACGESVSPDAQFCTNCGTELNK